MRSFTLKWNPAPWIAGKVCVIFFLILNLNHVTFYSSYCTKTNAEFCACVLAEEYVAFFDRLAFVRKCAQVAGSELTSRTNVLLVRQNLLTPGNGIIFTYKSQKNTKRSHHHGTTVHNHYVHCWAQELCFVCTQYVVSKDIYIKVFKQ